MGDTNNTSPLYITRFIAAYGVLLLHFFPKAFYTEDSLIPRLGEAVNYFFFISGFVMIIANKRYISGSGTIDQFSKTAFWIKRFARIYPLYILALLLCVAFHFFIKRTDPSIPYRFPLEAIGIQRWIYSGSINFPGWSVSCEFFFYFLFPFLLPYLLKYSYKTSLTIVLVFLLFGFSINFIWSEWVIPASKGSVVWGTINSSIYNHPVVKLSVFLAGNLCGLFYLKNNNWNRYIQRFSGIILLLSTVAVISILWAMPVDSPFIDAGLLTPFYFLFTLSICNLGKTANVVLGNRFFIFLGEISYGVYILQAPVHIYFLYLFTNGKRISTPPQFFAYTLVLIAVSAILYYLVEKPAKNKLMDLLNRPFVTGIRKRVRQAVSVRQGLTKI